MNTCSFKILVVASLIVTCQNAVAQDTSSAPATSITWITDYNEAVAQAASADRHIIAEFYTDWCKWCRVLEDSTFTDPQVIALGSRFIFARINAELDTATARKFNISGYPTVILLEKAGNEVDRVLGYLPPGQFAQTMENYLVGIGTLWTLQKDNREKQNNPETIYAIAEKHIARGEFAEARTQLQRVLSADPKNESGWADDAQFNLALLHRKERSWYKAVEAFRTVIEDYPESELAADAQIYIAWLLAKAGDTKEALESYRKFLKEYSNSSEVGWVKEQIDILEQVSEDDS